MIYIDTHSFDPYYHFGVEYYYAAVHPLPETVFLFWQTSPTLMVGKYQNALEEINRDYVETHGIQVVRRMSGGGTIYTDFGGWQYSFIEAGDTGEIHFQRYISPVIDALAELGITVTFNGRNDLQIDGRKISGNAQYKVGGYTVHHGSLLFDTDPTVIAAATTVDAYKIVSKGIKSVRDRVTGIAAHLEKPLDAASFRTHMVRHLLGTGSVHVPTSEEEAAFEKIADERFRGYDNIYGASPRFTIERTARFPGGKVQWKLDVKKGVITEAALSGDFFATEAADRLPQVLKGCRYERQAVYARLVESCSPDILYGVTLSELASSIADSSGTETET